MIQGDLPPLAATAILSIRVIVETGLNLHLAQLAYLGNQEIASRTGPFGISRYLRLTCCIFFCIFLHFLIFLHLLMKIDLKCIELKESLAHVFSRRRNSF